MIPELKKRIVIGVFILVILIGGFIFYKNMPECYLSIDGKKMIGYDLVSFRLNYWGSLDYKQYCKSPHYILQSTEPTLYVMKNFCDKVNNTKYYGEK